MYYFDLIFLQEWKIEKEEEMRIKMAQSGRYKQVRVNTYSQDIIERIDKAKVYHSYMTATFLSF